MKRGKVAFPWKSLRSTAQPALDSTVGAAQDDTEVEIPLKLIIPHFMSANKPTAGQKQVDVDTTIPDVFSKEDIAARTAPATSTAPAETPKPTPAAPAAAPPAAGAPPSELVAKICQIPGITGALVTMSDGLPMAKQLPAGVDGDALSGFVPELFKKATQYADASKLGAAAAAEIQTTNHTLSVRKSGDTFIAALGPANTALPNKELAQIASGPHS